MARAWWSLVVLVGVLAAGAGSALMAAEAAAVPAAPAEAAAATLPPDPVKAKAPTAEELDKAVAAMRGIDLSKVSDEDAKVRGEQLDKAWNTVFAAGPAGSARLKEELAKVDAAKEKDDFFRLGAAVLLWRLGGPSEAPAVARVWTSGVDLTLSPNYVFYAAFDAARTQDMRVLPMLTAILADRKVGIFVAQRPVKVVWPLTHEFIWGAFGPKGLAELMRLLGESKDDTTRESAALLLAKAQYLPALELIRRLAAEAKGDLRAAAIRSLGAYGHPQDYDFLAAGLKSKDPQEVIHFAYAIYEYDDLRAVPALVELLDSPDDALRLEVTGALVHLLTPEALEGLRRHCGVATNPGEREGCARIVAGFLNQLGLTLEAYAATPAAEKARLLAGLREKREAKYRATPSDRQLTHDDLFKAAASWQAAGRIRGGAYGWVEDRHVMVVATADDIPLLLAVKAKCYLRLSDECLSETRTLDLLIRRLGRARYRKVVGVCEKVEGLPAEPAK